MAGTGITRQSEPAGSAFAFARHVLGSSPRFVHVVPQRMFPSGHARALRVRDTRDALSVSSVFGLIGDVDEEREQANQGCGGKKLGGKIKKGVGRLIGNEQMQAEGRAEEIKARCGQRPRKRPSAAKGRSRK